nr:hypothetical protein [Clostridia bacterium]
MKLLECYVSSFGNLKDFSYKFGDKLNTVKEENGWGKSTFASFIKAMFYGLDDAKRTIEDNERKRFTPWNSTEKFGGSLTFEWGDKPYKVERFFGAKSSDDTVKLYDINSGKIYTEGSAVEDLGKRVFSIDEEGFLSTTYFSQKDFEIKSNSSITSKFNEVSEVSNPDAFDKAMKILEDNIRELKARGDKGKIAEIKRQITAANDDEERIKNSVRAIDAYKKDLETLERESAELDKNIKELTVKLQAAGKREAQNERRKRHAAVSAELSELREKAAAAEKTLNGKPLSLSQISDCERCVLNLRDISAKEEAAVSDLENYSGGFADEKSDKKRDNTPWLRYSLAVIAVLLVAAGVAVSAFVGLWGLVFLAAGLIVGAYLAFDIISAKNRTLRETQGLSAIREIYERKKREAEDYKDGRLKLTHGIENFFAEFSFAFAGGNYESKIAALKDAVRAREECAEKIAKAQAEIRELETAGVESAADGTETVSELNDKLKLATDWYKNKVSEAERTKMRINTLESSTEALFDVENRKARLKEALAESESRLKILTITAEYLKDADETLKIKYRAPLQDSLNRYVRMIAGKDIAVSIDTDMKVSVNITGAERETGFFSKGYRNLFEICKRFALTDILFTGEKPFIILDDPFSDLDDDKVAAAVALIKRLAEEYQILYFVCHESRRA